MRGNERSTRQTQVGFQFCQLVEPSGEGWDTRSSSMATVFNCARRMSRRPSEAPSICAASTGGEMLWQTWWGFDQGVARLSNPQIWAAIRGQNSAV
jgi:hypothetical protein